MTINAYTVGDGDIPMRCCIDILRAAGYVSYFSIEYESPCDCIVGITRGFKFLSSLG